MELTKSEKRICREIIERGLQNEFIEGLSKADKILKDWENNKKDNRDSYHALYKQITNFDKHIAKRYDCIRGSDYLFIIGAQLHDGIISEDDLKEFSEEKIAAIKMIADY